MKVEVKIKLSSKQEKFLKGFDLYVNKYRVKTYHIPNYFTETKEPGVYLVYTKEDIIQEGLNNI